MKKAIFFCFGQALFFVSQAQSNDSAVTGTPAYVRAAASHQYENPSILQRIFLGNNYRDEWATAVTLPVLSLLRSGFTIKKLGGGFQTKSLHLKDSNGKEWVLRTIDKDVDKALEKEKLKNPLARKIVKDMVSAAHPYGPLMVPDLAAAIGVAAAHPRFYFVADEESLGPYREFFAGKLCALEEKVPTPDGSKTDKTEELEKKLRKENEHLVLQKTVLYARLLDMLIGDWDRHELQWQWGKIDSLSRTYYYAVPEDRDQAFFYSNGIVVKLSGFFGKPHFIGFRKNISGLRKLNAKAWDFDHKYLNALARADWQNAVLEVQNRISDSVIEKAVRRVPPEIFFLSGETIEHKLKRRRDDFLKASLKYYEHLSQQVTVSGTLEPEVFYITSSNDSLIISMVDTLNNANYTFYQRAFSPAETKEISLYCIAGKDRFVMAENVSSPIRLLIYANKNEDIFDIKGKINYTVYDAPQEEK